MENPRIKFNSDYTRATLINRISERVTMVSFIRSDAPLTFYMIGEMVEHDKDKAARIVQTDTFSFPVFPPYIT